MSETNAPEVIVWLRNEALRNFELRVEKNEDGSWKHSARRRSTFYRRAHMLRRAAQLLQRYAPR